MFCRTRNMILKNQLPPIFIAFCSLVIIYLALQLDLSPPMIVGDSMQPRSFPIFLMILNIILAGILGFQLHQSPPAQLEKILMPTWMSMSLLVLFYGLTVTTDMFIGISVVMFLLSVAWGERRYYVSVINAIATPLAIFILFDEVLRIRFPRGIITNWYYG